MEKKIDKFDSVEFTDPVANMFKDIIVNDEELYSVTLHILDSITKSEIVTIKSIISKVRLERRVAVKKGKRQVFNIEKEFMSRGAATKVVDQLMHMSLLHVQYEQRLKIFGLTKRGVQVASLVFKHYRNEQLQKEESKRFSTTASQSTSNI